MKDRGAIWENFEEEIFEVLNNAFRRQECAARAAARLERVVVDRYIEEQQEPTTAADGVAEEDETVSQTAREFSADQFLTLFTSTNLLRLVRELLDAMELHELEEEITTTLIREAFSTQSDAGKAVGQRSKNEGEQFIGSDAELSLHNMREAAARAQRK